MRVRILAFATAATTLGDAESEIELADGATIDTLRQELVSRHPGLDSLWPRLAVAVDGELAVANTALEDGAEVALLPPVSGGERARARLVDGPIDVEALRAETGHDSCGAVTLFIGSARDNHHGHGVTGLAYAAYRRMAAASLEKIVRELETEAPGLRLGIVHRLGEVPVGQASVAIAAASPHRDASFAATRTALERLKRETPIWKRESYADGSSAWREEEPLVNPAAVSGP
jgi:molybdopterin synthase catalytic subunit